MSTISFHDKEGYGGEEYKVVVTDNRFEVKEVPKGKISVSSIYVHVGTWIVYTETDFWGLSFRLTPSTIYKDPKQIEKMAQALKGQAWTGEIRSLRLVTPGSMMLFASDNFCGQCLVITDTSDSIPDFDFKSMIIESGGSAPKHPNLDLVFVLDGSTSIGKDNFETVKEFSVKVSRRLNISPTTNRVGVVQYSRDVKLEFEMDKNVDKDTVESAIKNVSYQGIPETNTGKALEFVRYLKNWRELPVKRVVIVLTDGEAHDDVSTPSKSLRESDFFVYAVGVGPTPNDLTEMTNDPSKVTSLDNFDKLQEQIEKISAVVSQDAEWMLCGDEGKEWKAFPGYYTSDLLEDKIGHKVNSVKRLK